MLIGEHDKKSSTSFGLEDIDESWLMIQPIIAREIRSQVAGHEVRFDAMQKTMQQMSSRMVAITASLATLEDRVAKQDELLAAQDGLKRQIERMNNDFRQSVTKAEHEDLVFEVQMLRSALSNAVGIANPTAGGGGSAVMAAVGGLPALPASPGQGVAPEAPAAQVVTADADAGGAAFRYPSKGTINVTKTGHDAPQVANVLAPTGEVALAGPPHVVTAEEELEAAVMRQGAVRAAGQSSGRLDAGTVSAPRQSQGPAPAPAPTQEHTQARAQVPLSRSVFGAGGDEVDEQQQLRDHRSDPYSPVGGEVGAEVASATGTISTAASDLLVGKACSLAQRVSADAASVAVATVASPLITPQATGARGAGDDAYRLNSVSGSVPMPTPVSALETGAEAEEEVEAAATAVVPVITRACVKGVTDVGAAATMAMAAGAPPSARPALPLAVDGVVMSLSAGAGLVPPSSSSRPGSRQGSSSSGRPGSRSSRVRTPQVDVRDSAGNREGEGRAASSATHHDTSRRLALGTDEGDTIPMTDVERLAMGQPGTNKVTYFPTYFQVRSQCVGGCAILTSADTVVSSLDA
jgi:hypothetical protein